MSGALLLTGVLWIGFRTDFLPCTLDCGETYEAHVAARNLDRFGWRATMGLQDLAAGPDPAAHPALYVHNPNLGMYALAGLFALGIRDLHAQTPWLILPFLIGMLYLYLAVRITCQSGFLAACCLLQAASLYLLVPLWAFDALRTWSWLVTFGLIYHVARASEGRRAHWMIAGLYLGLALGVDYPFALFVATVAVALAVFRLVPLRVRSAWLLVLVATGGLVALRQVQVALAVGPGVWWADLGTTVLRRVSVLALLVTPPNPQTFAIDHALVVWPGGEGPPQPLTWLWIMGRAYTAVLGGPVLGLLLGWIWAVRHRDSMPAPVRACLRLSLALGVAMAVTFAVFGQYLAAFYGVMLMPLVVHWVVLLLGGVLYLLLTYWRTTLHWGRVTIPVGALLLVAFVGWRGATEIRNTRLLPPAGYPGRAALAELRGRSVATLWISSAPSAYTGEWAAVLRTMGWMTFSTRPLVFDPAVDYYAFFERDRDRPVYRAPEFIVIPQLHTWGLARTCEPLGGAVFAFADGCSSVEVPTSRPVWRRGAEYVIYETRDHGPRAEGD